MFSSTSGFGLTINRANSYTLHKCSDDDYYVAVPETRRQDQKEKTKLWYYQTSKWKKEIQAPYKTKTLSSPCDIKYLIEVVGPGNGQYCGQRGSLEYIQNDLRSFDPSKLKFVIVNSSAGYRFEIHFDYIALSHCVRPLGVSVIKL